MNIRRQCWYSREYYCDQNRSTRACTLLSKLRESQLHFKGHASSSNLDRLGTAATSSTASKHVYM